MIFSNSPTISNAICFLFEKWLKMYEKYGKRQKLFDETRLVKVNFCVLNGL